MTSLKSKQKNQTISTRSALETFNIGKSLGEICRGGEIFLLFGDLGAGKTSLLQGLASGLGYDKKVNSPTFNILKLYQIDNKAKDIKIFCHIDAYRLNSGNDLLNLGIDEFFQAKDVVVAIEWAEKVREIWPKNYIKIEIKTINEIRRKIIIN